MEIAADILTQLQTDFCEAEWVRRIAQLSQASQSDRVQRCIVWASRGHRWYFDFLCQLAEEDYRDVILSAEYDRLDARLYDFARPIPEARLDDPFGRPSATAIPLHFPPTLHGEQRSPANSRRLPADVENQLEADFPPGQSSLRSAQLKESTSDERLQRCIAWSARGHPAYFDYLCQMTKIDVRAIVKNAECERFGARLYDFIHPIGESRLEDPHRPTDRH